jgi:hypothetical protein
MEFTMNPYAWNLVSMSRLVIIGGPVTIATIIGTGSRVTMAATAITAVSTNRATDRVTMPIADTTGNTCRHERTPAGKAFRAEKRDWKQQSSLLSFDAVGFLLRE